MRFRLLIAALAVCLAVSAQSKITVQQLKDFVRSSVRMKLLDKDVASYLHGVKLTEKLDDQTIEDLQAAGGLGPKTMVALKALRDASASLGEAKPAPLPPPPPKLPPPPSSEEQAAILDEVRENSLHYSDSLPNYLCLQYTRWYVNPYGKTDSWISNGHMTERLSYVDHHEDYKTVAVNDQVTTTDARNLGHSLSRGEFGSMLREIFERQSRTQFEWERWSGNGKQWWYVFSFRVPVETSQYTISYGRSKDEQRITVGFSGSIFVDRDTKMVMRLKMHADNIPPGFPVNEAAEQLDYEYQKIGDQEFLLPRQAEMLGKAEGKYLSKNTIDFRLYQKFSADAVIKFDQMDPNAAPAPSEEKPKDQVPPK